MERSGQLIPAPAWSFACPDWWERLKAGRSPVPELPLDDAEAARAVAIFNRLRLPDVPGMPAMADAAGDWFRDIVRALFGSLDGSGNDLVRHVAEIFALVPKKNSKTTGGAGIMLTALLMNKRPRAEFLLIGPTQEIADLAFQQVAGMIAADATGFLAKRFQVKDHVKTIVDRKREAKLKIKTFDMRVMTGSKPAGVLLDELHIVSSLSYASRVLRQIRGGLLPNQEGFLIIITTQSDQPPAGAFKAELQYARGVRDGRITDDVRTLPVLYEFPEAVQTDKRKPWLDPAKWPPVLPNLGRSIAIDRLKADQAQATEKGEEELQIWASQHLNIEIGLGLHSARWRGADYWEGAADESLISGEADALDELLERSDVVTVGADGGGLDDLFGLAVLGRCRKTRDWLLWGRAWAQTDVLERRKDIAERLHDFIQAGDLVLCERPTQDVEDIAAIVKRIADAGRLPERFGVGLDPVGVAALIDALAAAGIETEANGGPVCAVYQGYKLSGAVWGMERKLKDGTLWHAGQALMAWCVGNAKAEQRGNAMLITKETAGRAKIDPLVAAFNAFTLMARNPEPARRAMTEVEVLAQQGYIF